MIDLDERLDRAATDLWAVVAHEASPAPAARPRARMVLATAVAASVLVALGAVWV